MKRIALVVCAGLSLAGCQAGFGTFTDKSTPAQYIKTHGGIVHHKAPSAATAVSDDGTTDGCAGACTAPAPTVTPDAAPVKPQKKPGFWWKLRQHFPFKKKPTE